jgi:hypothetical protein
LVGFTNINATYCAFDQNYNLQPFPLGGVLSGAGTNGTLFNPYLAGQGLHTLFYNISGICSVQFSENVTVFPFVNVVLETPSELLYCRGDATQQLNVTTSGGTITGVGVYVQHAGGGISYNQSVVNSTDIIFFSPSLSGNKKHMAVVFFFFFSRN